MTLYVVGIHSCDGSMGEAVWPQWTDTVESELTADELEKKYNALLRGSEGEVIAVVTTVGDPRTVEDSLADLSKNEDFFEEEEDEDPEEAALNAKVDDLMVGETKKLDGLFKDTYHKPRQTQIQSYEPEFTRYPVEEGYQPYQGIGEEFDDEGDPFEDMTELEFNGLSDDEFLDILHGRLSVADYRKSKEG